VTATLDAAAGNESAALAANVELLGIERLEEHGRRLAALLTVSRRQGGSPPRQLRRLRANRKALNATYRFLAADARGGELSSPAAEWFLDNFPMVSAASRDILHDLPSSFFRRLPLWYVIAILPACALAYLAQTSSWYPQDQVRPLSERLLVFSTLQMLCLLICWWWDRRE